MSKKPRYLAPLTLSTALIVTGVVTTSARPSPQNNDDGGNGQVTRAEIGRLDLFLDTHPAIAQQLTKDPSLIESRQYIESQPAVRAFLQDHPEIREDLRTNPQGVMRDVGLLDKVQARTNPKPELREDALSASQMKTLDAFMDAHPMLSKQLEANPSLIRNRDFLTDHPELVAFLQNHPDLREDWRENPQATMNALSRLDAATATPRPQPDEVREDALSASQVNALDTFMDAHPEISKQLEANPSLINSKEYLANHPELVAFLQSHPDLREDWRENPQAAMTALSRLDAAQSAKTVRPKPVLEPKEDSLSNSQIAALDGFLDNHPEIARQLQTNPALIDSKGYIADHPELSAFLQSHPDLREDWQENPQVAMKDLRTFDDATNPNLTRGQAETLDTFMDAHPEIAKQLEANPSLINNKEFMSDHPELVTFLQNHPDLAEAWRDQPQRIMTDLTRIDKAEPSVARVTEPKPVDVDRDIMPASVEKLDSFLDEHPTITEELRAHPTLITESSFISDHPELKSFLVSNPGIAQQLKSNPAAFMSDLKKLDARDAATTAKGQPVRVASVKK